MRRVGDRWFRLVAPGEDPHERGALYQRVLPPRDISGKVSATARSPSPVDRKRVRGSFDHDERRRRLDHAQTMARRQGNGGTQGKAERHLVGSLDQRGVHRSGGRRRLGLVGLDNVVDHQDGPAGNRFLARRLDRRELQRFSRVQPRDVFGA